MRESIVLERKGQRTEATLTDEHATSSYAQPVVVVDGEPFGVGDLAAAELVVVDGSPEALATLRQAGFAVQCAHAWEHTDPNPAGAGSTGYRVRCSRCGATGWQRALWCEGPGGEWGFWPVGEVEPDREGNAP